MFPKPAQSASREILRPAAVIAAARQQTGLHDFGDERFMEPLTRWLDSVIDEAPLTEAGIVFVQQTALGPLMTRLRVHDFVKRHPEIHAEDVSDPVVVISFPRSGSTKLQRMLARDPGVQSLPTWRLLNPVPLPGEKLGESHLRRAIAEDLVAQMREHFPEVYASHAPIANQPDEEIMALEIDTQLCLARAHAPTFRNWWMNRPRRERAHLYGYLRTLLQCTQFENGGRQGRPFILKAPMHLGDLPLLLDVFPNATVVHIHRKINTSFASTARVLELMMGMATNDLDLEDIGNGLLELYGGDANQHVADRKTLGDRLQIMDVHYDDVLSDCLNLIRKIWHFRGRALTHHEEAEIARWEGENPQHQFGKHTYKLEDYGLTSERIAKASAAYLDAFPYARG